MKSGRFQVTVGRYVLAVERGGLPSQYEFSARHAMLAEEFDIRNAEREHCFVSVTAGRLNADLVVAQTFEPNGESGFDPGVLIVPEADTLFIGAGERVLVYSLRPPARLAEYRCEHGFWGFQQHLDCVVLSAELELAVFDLSGNRRWSMFVEPPWSYEVVAGDIVRLDVIGVITEFNLHRGPIDV